ncbi:DUF977 family protein, partial [Escherichia coli]|uniref:DUF977 family protein n=1 Tax=Escherichia coli TaxID=562 RepID=UPI000B651302
MAKPFTHEQREELKARIIGLVRKNERMTISQLERATGAGWHSVRRCLVDVLACGDLVMPGKSGVFTSEQVYLVRRKAAEKTTRQTLILKLADGKIRRYNKPKKQIESA